jgi:hypothetical protein
MTQEPSAELFGVEYLCGHSDFRDGLWGQLLFSVEWIGFTELDTEEPAGDGLPMASVESVEISEGEETRTSWGRVAANLLDNLLSDPTPSGGMPGQEPIAKTTRCVNLAISTRDGQTACLRIHHASLDEVKATITPVLVAAGVPLEEVGAA